MANQERVQLLVDALRSGKFLQTDGALEKVSDHETSNCCLGVACRVAKANGLDLVVSDNTRHGSGTRSFGGNSSYLPASVAEWFGFEDEDGAQGNVGLTDEQGSLTLATVLNDNDNYTFPMIADAFERTFLVEPDGQDGPVLVPGQEA